MPKTSVILSIALLSTTRRSANRETTDCLFLSRLNERLFSHLQSPNVAQSASQTLCCHRKPRACFQDLGFVPNNGANNNVRRCAQGMGVGVKGLGPKGIGCPNPGCKLDTEYLMAELDQQGEGAVMSGPVHTGCEKPIETILSTLHPPINA